MGFIGDFIRLKRKDKSHVLLLEAHFHIHSLQLCSHMQSRYYLPNLIDKEKDLRADDLFKVTGIGL